MSKVIKAGNHLVAVSEEIYKEYYKMLRHEKYLEVDIKLGSSFVDLETGKVKYRPSKEDSIERLLDKGKDFADPSCIEDMVVAREMTLILTEAVKSLDDREKDLVDKLFYKNMTIRDFARKEGISHVAVIKRKNRILLKLRKFFSISGYQEDLHIG
ncbi:sigma-70 family RNA polymerase sigma factor [Proteocatella sphenisci]|uniref:sigma-70 family RNA polymerase sigma factor n=1 Tax=Proteocatella sphenisci TaxID=181070 RepID=UPI0004ACD3B0|nr:sigma-70 family RNA polymerase sigma factor [Proteocatella sphenisci]